MNDAPYRDPERPTDERVDDLLGRMTDAELAGQLVGTWAGQLTSEKDLETVAKEVRAGVGAVSPFGVGPADVRDPVAAAETANRLQQVAREETRLGIPLLVPVDAIHGHAYVDGATVFPHGLGMGATRDPALVRQCARATAREARATGATTTYAPTCDVARDARWGRLYETYGESPALCGTLAAAAVEGYQTDLETGVAATAKHFPAYSQSARGEDAAPVDLGSSELRRVFLPPFEAAVDAGVEAVMPTYSAVDGAPAHGSRHLLEDLLRRDLGFSGLVTSDWAGVRQLWEAHHTAATRTEAVRQSRQAGLDVASVGARPHADALASHLASGAVARERVEESARRVLSLKIRLGLFADPYVDPEAVEARLRTDDHRALACRAARESVTLFENDGTLPLSAETDLLVTGPAADTMANQVGGWGVPDPPGTTVREGLDAAGSGTVRFEQGATVSERRDIDAAARAAADADAAVVACGEGWYVHEFGGESATPASFPRRSRLRLPAAQRDLLEAVVETGTPTVCVLLAGRPLSTPWAAEHCAGLLHAFYPGSEGGQAVAETLFGAVDPGGALPVSVPRSTGHLPTLFDRRPQPRPAGPTHEASYDPLYPFGHGLSYTDMVDRDLSLSASTLGPGETLTATVTVENTGDRAGERVLDLFARDAVSSRVTPEAEHVASGRVSVPAGEQRTVSLSVDATQLAVATPEGRRLEAGEHTLTVGLGGDLTETVEVEG